MSFRQLSVCLVGMLIIVLAVGCSDDKGVNNQRPENRIGPEGGTFAGSGGEATLSVPAGALEADVDFTIEENYAPEPAPGTMKHLTSVYSFGPGETTFDPPATVGLYYDDAELGDIPEDLAILCTDAGDGSGWQELSTTLDTENNFATVEVTHLSDFVVMVDTVLPTTVEINENVTQDTTWNEKDTILISGDITILPSVELTIQPGAILMFQPSARLSVLGHLTARGEEQKQILFTATADTLGGEPTAGHWGGVAFEPNSDGTISHCIFRYAHTGIDVNMASPHIDHCILEEFSYRGIGIDGGSSDPPITPVVESCIIGRDESDLSGVRTGIYVYRATDVIIADCAISNCKYGLDFYSYQTTVPHFQVTGCDIRDCAFYGVFAHAGG